MSLIRPTVLDIDLDALAANFREIQNGVGRSKVMPILKANAYGHGLTECAARLEQEGAEYFGVAFLEEALELREAGIRTPILTLGGVSGRQVDCFITNKIDLTASSVMKLRTIEERAKLLGERARVHIKIDTGMERIGVHYYTAEKLLEETLACRHCEIIALYSHLALSEEEDSYFSKLQLERFLECCAFFEKHSLPLPLRHIANSAAILALPETHLDLVRPGLILFGIPPAPHLKDLTPKSRVMSLRSEVVYFKVVPKGAGVSYGHTWFAPEQTRIATIPVGYGDGFPRGLSNRGEVLIGGKRHPIVGRVCMDQFMVNVGPDGTAYNGDEVVLIGKQDGEEIKVEDLAELLDTDPRAVLCGTNIRIPRRFLSGERM